MRTSRFQSKHERSLRFISGSRTPLFKRLTAITVTLVSVPGFATILRAQDAGSNAQLPPNASFAYRVLEVDTQGPLQPTPIPTPAPTYPAPSSPGLVIIPTFNVNVDQPTRDAINNVINFYESTFSTPITVNIEFHNMSTGLGSSFFVFYNGPYSSYRTALGTAATSADDATALANTPTGSTNPINGTANTGIKSANGRAVGLNTPEVTFGTGPCPGFTGSGCIGINVTLANSHGYLMSVVEHEIDEILGLGSALNGTSTPATPWTEDLFRWASPGVRSYAANPSTSNPCIAPSAFFSIDGGSTNLNEFNNCANGGDYGDWITHTPSQVQDAFTNFSGTPTLTFTSTEIRALDVIGYNLATISPLGLRFVPVTPCRVTDTRLPNGPFGGPVMAANTTRNFTIPASACGIPSTAQGYALNITVVPTTGTLGFLTIWPAGQPQPLVSTLNSLDGRIKANAAIVPAGAGGAVSVFVTDQTHVIIDINGYFAPPASAPTGLVFYPLTPCRVMDTRLPDDL